MLYLKCAAAGVAGALIVTVVVLLAAIIFFNALAYTGSGGLGAVSVEMYGLPYPGLIGFGVGFWWQFRRSRRGLVRGSVT